MGLDSRRMLKNSALSFRGNKFCFSSFIGGIEYYHRDYTAIKMSDKVSEIKSELLAMASMPMDSSIFKKATEKLHEILGSTECSLWSINRNMTGDLNPDEEKIPVSTSLLHREPIDVGPLSNREDFAHDLERGFFKIVMGDSQRVYHRCERDEVEEYGHRSMDFVRANGLVDFIVIPISDIAEKEKVIAVLELSYKKGENTISDDEWKEIAQITKSFFSSVFHRYLVSQEQTLIATLITTQEECRDKGAGTFFDCLIDEKFQSFFNYQAASVFIWDSYHTRYNLVSSTDKSVDKYDSKYSYERGEGSTGRVGETGRPYISDNCSHQPKWCEETTNDPQTVMIVPIMNPSDPKDVVGIIRFLNKKNPVRDEFVDYFNDVDLKLVEFAAKYLSLVIDFYNKKEEQSRFISRLIHEFKTPTNSIFKTVDRILNNINDEDFIKTYLRSYLEGVRDFADLQRWQASSTLYLMRSGKRIYEKKRCSLSEIIKKSISVVRPFARDYGVLFDNIKLNTYSVQSPINVDEVAFVTVFYNLFTNAIKYHGRNPDSFLVSISCYESETGIRIEVSDWGIGISPQDTADVFQIGYRGERALRENASGFGVGLSVVKQIVEDFGGTVRVTRCQQPTTIEINFNDKKTIL